MFPQNNELKMVWRGVSGDERLWSASWSRLSGWKGPRELGGGFSSTHAPSLAVAKASSDVHMVHKGSGTDQRIYHSRLGVHYVVRTQSGPFQTTGRPGIAILSGREVIAWREPNNNALMWSTNGSPGWSQPRQIGAQTSHGPAMATFGNTVFMVWKAIGDESPYWVQFNGSSWSAIKPLPVAAGTVLLSDTPALIPSLTGLTMAYKGTQSDARIWLSDFQPGSSWSAPRPAVPTDGAIHTSHGPAIGTQDGVPRLSWKGLGDQKVWSSAQNGGRWTVPGPIAPAINSAASPAMVSYTSHHL
ncbi:hypothetical protein [Streptomyces sp. NPDC002990]